MKSPLPDRPLAWLLFGILVLLVWPAQEALAGNKLGAELRMLQRTKITSASLVEASHGGALKLRLKGRRAFVLVLIEAAPEAERFLRTLGAEGIWRHGPVFTAEVPVDALAAIEALPEVRRLRAAHKMEPLLDVSVPVLPSNSLGLEVNRTATPVGGYLTYPPPWDPHSGAGVVFGLVDTGIDIDHQDFKNANGSTRILRLWDQASSEDCTAQEINAGTCLHQDTGGHGTHVAGTAAGNGRATGNSLPNFRYVGVAPAADIVAVATTFYDADILNGVAYVFARAAELGKPAVVNLSLGGHYGPHDGTDPFDLGLDAITGPGQVVVTSAGNEGSSKIHNQGSWAGSNITFQFKPGANTRNYIDIDVWHNGLDSYQVRVQKGTGTSQTWLVGETATKNFGSSNCTIAVTNPAAGETESNGDKEIQIEYLCQSTNTWSITFIDGGVSAADPNKIDAWLYYDAVGASAFTNGDNLSSVGSPGTAKSTITVAAYTSKKSWKSINGSTYSFTGGSNEREICPFSSLGPTRDGRNKPDLAAPGSAIGSALSSDYSPYTELTLPDGVHVIMQGTSMSSPHIAGLAALLLQVHATYIPAAIKSILAYSATRDTYVGTTPNTTWGYGKAQATNALALAGQDLPRFSSASQLPAAREANTVVAGGAGFVPKSTSSPERYLFQWQRLDAGAWKNIPDAIYPRLEPGNLHAGDTIRVVVTPHEPSDAPGSYAGLLVGASQVAGQTIQSGASFASHTGAEGWCMVCIPTTSDSAILGDFPGNPFYEWNEEQQAYQEAATVERGRGYWVEVAAGQGAMHSEGSDTADEYFITPLLTYTGTGLKPGRHLLGNPFNQPIFWENTYVSPSPDPASFTLRVGDPGALAYIHNVYYAAYGPSGGYRHYDPTDLNERDGKIFPWEGFWVMVKSDVYLKIPRAQPVPKTAWQSSPYPLPVQREAEPAGFESLVALLGGPAVGSAERGNTARDWRIKLSAFSGKLRDDYNYLGVHPKGLDEYDPRDIPDAGTMNGQNQVLLYTQHDGWGREAGRYCVDIQSASTDRQHRWDLTLKTQGLEEPVTLLWQVPPPGWRLTLVDNTTRKQWDMSRRRSITLPFGDGERSLSVLARRQGPPL